MEKVVGNTAGNTPNNIPSTTPGTFPGTTSPQHEEVRKRRRTLPRLQGDAYRRFTHKAGVIVGFGVVAGIWYIGAFFTLEWLKYYGVPVDSVYWWVVPIAITLLEVGLQPDTPRINWVHLLWLGVLLVDAFATAFGASSWVNPQGVLFPWYWFGLVGVFIALSPERIGRALWTELWR